MKNYMPKFKKEYGLTPTQNIGDRCVRGGWLYVCKDVKKIVGFIYITELEKGVFEEGEF